MGEDQDNPRPDSPFQQGEPGSDSPPDQPGVAPGPDDAAAVDPAELERLRSVEGDLRSQLNATNARLEATQRSLDTLLSQRPTQDPDPAPDLTPELLPDPTVEPEKFNQAIFGLLKGTRAESEKAVEKIRRDIREQLESDQQARRTEVLWKEFQDENPRYKDQDEFVGAAIRAELKARGSTSLPTDRQGLKRAVKKRCDDIFNRMLEHDRQNEPTRTGGLGGASRGPTPPKKKGSEPRKTLCDQLFESQERHGII